MKKSFVLFSIAAFISAAFVSCNKVEVETILEEDNTTVKSLTFAISDEADTKVVLAEEDGKFFGKWENGDKIGSITTKTKNYSTVNATVSPVTFSVYSVGGLSKGNTINLWYPFRTAQTNAEAVALSIPAAQKQMGDNFDFKAMPMVAEQITVTDAMVSATNNTVVGVVGFYNLGSVIDFCIFTDGGYADEKILSVTFNAGSPIAGEFTKNLTTIDASDAETLGITGYEATSVTTELIKSATAGASSAAPLHVYMVVAPGSYSGTVVVTTDKADYTWTVSTPLTFNRSGIRSLGLKLDKAGVSRVARTVYNGNFSFELNRVSYISANTDAVVWSHGLLTMTSTKVGTGTNANNYLPPTNTSSRFYKGNSLMFTPASVPISKVEFVAATDGYATALNGTTWTNASSSISGTTVTIVPDDATSEFGSSSLAAQTGATEVKVYYDNTDYSISKVISPVGCGTFTVKIGESVVSTAKIHSTITLDASNETGYVFTGWTVKDSENNDITVTANTFKMPASNVTVTANFASASATYAVTLVDPSEDGCTYTATANDTELSSGDELGESVIVTLAASPKSGYELTGWSVYKTGDPSTKVTVTSNQFTMPGYPVTIEAAFAQIHYYVKVTETPADWSGNYLIVYEKTSTDAVVFDGSLGTLDKSANVVGGDESTTYTIAAGKIRADADLNAATFTFTSNTIKSKSGKWINQTSWANGLASSATSSELHSISFDGDGNLVVQGTGNSSSTYVQLCFNKVSGQHRFRFMKTPGGNNMAVTLYKYQ